MDFQRIDSICESFFIDNDLYRKMGRKKAESLQFELSNEMKSFVRELREEDLELYTLAYDQPKLRQRKILNEFLRSTIEVEYPNILFENNENENTELFEIGTTLGVLFGAGVLVSIVSSFMKRRTKAKIGRGVMKSLENIAETLNSAAKILITDRRRNIRFRTAIIMKNAEDCYKKECNVNPDDLGLMASMKVRDKNQIPSFDKEKADCLRECYLEKTVQLIGMLFDVYFSCLKRTGEFDQIQNVSSDELLKMVTGARLSTECESYFDKIKESFDSFYELIKFLYPNSRDKQSAWMKRIRDELIKKKKQVDRGQQRR